MRTIKESLRSSSNETGSLRCWIKECVKQKYLLLMVLPGFLLVLIFHYIPIYGILIAFKDYNVAEGIWGSPWVGLRHFNEFLSNPLAGRLFLNTVLLGVYSLVFGFPAPIILAFLLNEIKHSMFKRTVQTIVYIPFFISIVVVIGMLSELASVDGALNSLRSLFGFERIPMLAREELFRTLFVGTNIWREVGWGTIIYLAALSGVDPTLYDVASIDGANRWQKMINITWPTILPTTTILLILSLGGILGSDFQMVLLMQNPAIMEVSDVIGTYVYRQGLLGARFEHSAAVGLFLSVISFGLVFTANYVSRRISENSLW